jgi:hypothetical protein
LDLARAEKHVPADATDHEGDRHHQHPDPKQSPVALLKTLGELPPVDPKGKRTQQRQRNGGANRKGCREAEYASPAPFSANSGVQRFVLIGRPLPREHPPGVLGRRPA